ncbi:MAG: hypothetical protein R2932_00085 [Caldilineaceae bacterium]
MSALRHFYLLHTYRRLSFVLSHAMAMTILNEPLPKITDQGAGLCGYGGMAEKLAGEGPLLTADLPAGIASGVLAGAAAKELFLPLAGRRVLQPSKQQPMHQRELSPARQPLPKAYRQHKQREPSPQAHRHRQPTARCQQRMGGGRKFSLISIPNL